MSNEKYLNYYVEVLTGTMTDAVIRNISLQANARVTESVINDQVKKNEDLIKQVNLLNDEIKQLKESNQQSENTKITELENKVKGHLDTINHLNIQLTELSKMKNEYENVKHQVNHVETFKKELIKERDDHQKTHEDYKNKIKELNNQIEYLQLTPAKRKKLEGEKLKDVEITEPSSALPLTEDITKDGGSF